MLTRGCLIRLTDKLDTWHSRRAEKHGRLYVFLNRDRIVGDIIEAKSLATGVICTFEETFIEEAPHAIQEPEGS
jgi:hypothetical protein